MIGGIFVGGAGTRMGGAAKGLLLGPDGQPLVVRTAELLRAQGITPVLVGLRAEYTTMLPALPDAVGATGPIAGLLALLEHAGDEDAIALACDMPFLSASSLARLAAAPLASIVAPRRDGRWEPFFSRHRPRAVLPHARALAGGSLQRLFDRAGAAELFVSPMELRDWDTPEDVTR